MKVTNQNPYLQLVNSYLIDSPTPLNINYLYGFGSLLGINLILLILTGLFLSKHYNPSISLAFLSSEHILRDVNLGWLLRYTHANLVSLFFILVYLHIGKALFYGTYRSRPALWTIGVFIFILMKAIAF